MKPDTPRTDAVRDLPCGGIEKAVALTQHARELERENAELRGRLEALVNISTHPRATKEEIRMIAQEARAALTRAK